MTSVPSRAPAVVSAAHVVTPDQEGSFSLVCTELCGTGHATMRAPVVVESQQEFEAWLAEQAKAQSATAGGGSAASSGGT